uniref:Uncharacterized protein n=1 Tax=Ciona intestinalis TaxID=7719 RepID=H2XVN6_CIOIN
MHIFCSFVKLWICLHPNFHEHNLFNFITPLSSIFYIFYCTILNYKYSLYSVTSSASCISVIK